MKRIGKRLISVLLIALMVCVMLPTTAFAAGGETQTCKFQILYVSDEFYIGYNYGDSWTVNYTCQYTTSHSGSYNHSIACSVIKEQVDKAKGKVGSDWEVKGWSKQANANPTIYTTYTDTTATQTSYTIYIVAKKNAVTTNYSLSYDGNGASSGVPATQNGSSTTGSYTFDVSTQKPVRDGYEFLGWSSALNGSVDIGAKVTLNSTAPNKTIYAAWKEIPAQTYTVTYTDGAGGEVFADQVTSGILSGTATPDFDGTPARKGYVFYGWNPVVAEKVTADATYTATWEVDANGNGKADKDEDKYTVTYTDGVDDEEVFADQVTSDILSGTATPDFDGTPARKGYVFYGWNPVVAEKVTADATYTATWEVDANGNGKADKDEDKYTVTYTDGVDGEEIFADQVTSDILSGSATPAFKGTPVRTGYTFKGWNPAVSDKVDGDAVYTAVWEKNSAPTNPTDPSSPKTGDESNLALWVSLMTACAAVVVIMLFGKKRQHKY